MTWLLFYVWRMKAKNRPFDEYVAGIVGRMLEKCPKEKAFLEQFSLHYYLADNKSDTSIARVVDADYPDIVSSLAGGQDFAVVLNKEPLLKLDSEDSLAFVLGHELSHIMYQKGCFKGGRLPGRAKNWSVTAMRLK